MPTDTTKFLMHILFDTLEMIGPDPTPTSGSKIGLLLGTKNEFNFRFKLKSKKQSQIEPTFGGWVRSPGSKFGSGWPSDFSVSSCFGHIQSTIIGKKKKQVLKKINYVVIDSM